MLVKRLRHENRDSPVRAKRVCPWFGQQRRTKIPGLRYWAGLFWWHCMGKDLEAGIVRGLHGHFISLLSQYRIQGRRPSGGAGQYNKKEGFARRPFFVSKIYRRLKNGAANTVVKGNCLYFRHGRLLS
jgi:hypothetical protein